MGLPRRTFLLVSLLLFAVAAGIAAFRKGEPGSRASPRRAAAGEEAARPEGAAPENEAEMGRESRAEEARPPAGDAIRLEVVDEEGAPVATAEAALFAGSLDRAPLHLAAADGLGRILLPEPGDLVCVVRAPGFRTTIASRIDEPEFRRVLLAAEHAIAGILVDDAGRPMPGVPLSISSDPLQTARTGLDGRFRFEGLGPLRYEIGVLEKGAPPARREAFGGEEDLRIVVERWAGIEGRLVAVEGTPLDGRRISVGNGPATAETDSGGRFALAPLAPGLVTLVAEGVPPLRLLLASGERRGDLLLRQEPRQEPPPPQPECGVRLLVVDASGAPVDAKVHVDGALAVDRLPGGARVRFREGETLRLSVAAPGFAGLLRRSWEPSRSGEERIRLERSAAIEGALPLDPEAPLELYAVSGSGDGARRDDAAWGDDGLFRVEDLAPGRFELFLAREGALPERIAEGNAAPGENVRLGALALPGPLRIDSVVTDRDGRPLGGARVTAHVETALGPTEHAVAVTRADGRFRLDAPRRSGWRLSVARSGCGTAVVEGGAVPPAIALPPECEVRVRGEGELRVRLRGLLLDPRVEEEPDARRVRGIPPGRAEALLYRRGRVVAAAEFTATEGAPSEAAPSEAGARAAR